MLFPRLSRDLLRSGQLKSKNSLVNESEDAGNTSDNGSDNVHNETAYIPKSSLYTKQKTFYINKGGKKFTLKNDPDTGEDLLKTILGTSAVADLGSSNKQTILGNDSSIYKETSMYDNRFSSTVDYADSQMKLS